MKQQSSRPIRSRGTRLRGPRRLDAYRAKRDPERTPEPLAATPVVLSDVPWIFVVQQHSARRMHWDVRLEIDGALTSWAVPRGPSPDPKEKRLAVQTEDHPLEYARFEGIIPPGNYGAGAMIVWDRGTYRILDGVSPLESLERGKLDIEFLGHKLRGRWALVRTRSESNREWLIFKKADGALPVAPELTVGQPASILSGLTVVELAAATDRTAELDEQAKSWGAPVWNVRADITRPMLADTGPEPFSDDAWIFELKYDGVRALALRDDRQLRLLSRNGNDLSASFPELADALLRLPCDRFVLDGEIVAHDERGASSFDRLQQRLGLTEARSVDAATRRVPVTLCAFDLLAAGRHDIRTLPLLRRKQLLARIAPQVGLIRIADHVRGDGKGLFDLVSRERLEGIMAKRSDSPYRSGRRSSDWLKLKTLATADLAVVGATRGKGSRQSLGALMLAWGSPRGFVYAGNVGSGFTEDMLASLHQRLDPDRRPTPAFSGGPTSLAREGFFVEPSLVAEVRYANVTTAGILRHPVFLRLRDDKSVEQADSLPQRSPAVSRERTDRSAAKRQLSATATRSAPKRAVKLSHLDKIFFPEHGYTKGDLIEYYRSIWPLLGPYLRDRPLMLTRYPDGIHGKSFFQKYAPDFVPDWFETHVIEGNHCFLCNDLDSLLYVINLGCIPLHIWSARRGSLERPDWTILDLDPKGAPFADVVRVARHIGNLLDSVDAPGFVKTSGQSGLHVLIPLAAEVDHATARAFAELIARITVNEIGEICTIARSLDERGGKVYIDFLQNGFGKTIASPFSVRPVVAASVSTPLRWSELSSRLDPSKLTIESVPKRFRRRTDPMRGVLAVRTDIARVLQKLETKYRE